MKPSQGRRLYDLVEGAVDYVASYQRHRQEEDTIREAQRVSTTFSAYSDREVEELIRKIEGCRDRFIAQGRGADRARCLCSIFNEIKAGNGGWLPNIDDWQKMCSVLQCAIRDQTPMH